MSSTTFFFHQVRNYIRSVASSTCLQIDLTAYSISLPGTDSPILPEICNVLDFRTPEQFPVLTRIGSVFLQRAHGQTYERDSQIDVDGHRQLQFEGERCDQNIFDVASANPLLSTFVELLDAANLEDIFLCAGV